MEAMEANGGLGGLGGDRGGQAGSRPNIIWKSLANEKQRPHAPLR